RVAWSRASSGGQGSSALRARAAPRKPADSQMVVILDADLHTECMKPTNREIAVVYLDLEIQGTGVSSLLQEVKKAFEQGAATNLEFNAIALGIDPAKQTVTLSQDWYACQPETFTVSEFVGLVQTSRRRWREKFG
ncbi:MAG: hypothetical protein ACWA47_00160, partial [Brevirhabdus sp.]